MKQPYAASRKNHFVTIAALFLVTAGVAKADTNYIKMSEETQYTLIAIALILAGSRIWAAYISRGRK
jgi:hypothetical membrane protein